MANLDITRGRSTALNLTNQTGAQSNPGDVVVIDTAHVDSYVASSSSNTVAPIGIVDEVIGISSNGRIVVSGYARAVKTTGTTSRADYLYASSTSLSASNMPGTTPAVGAFGYVTTGGSGTGTKAYIFDPVVAASGTAVSYASNSNQVDTANTSGASSLVARGDHVHLGVTSIAVTSNTLSGPLTLLAEGSIGITKKNATTYAINAVAGSGGGGGGATNLAGGSISLTSGNITTTSTSFVDLTGATVTFTTGARRVQVNMLVTAFNSGTGNACYYDVAVDGTLQGGSSGLANESQITGGADDHSVSISYLTAALSAGSHTIKIQWKVSAGTGTTRASSVAPLTFSAYEVYVA